MATTRAKHSRLVRCQTKMATLGSLLLDFVYDFDNQTEILLTSKQRLKQQFFRAMVLSSYDYKCAITGIDNVELLVAGHIMPWALHVVSRLDPSNGLCLSALCDKAFDKGLIALDEKYKLLVSNDVQQATRPHFEAYVGKPITLPNRFRPSQEFLSYHRSNVFRQ